MSEITRLQSLSLDDKIALTEDRILQWFHYYKGKVYISFSGGKDSTVLLHIARRVVPDVKAVFCDTGLEFPEIKDFVKTVSNVETIRPKMSFRQVLDKYGYPVISKEQSCYIDQYRNTKNERLKDKRWNGRPKGVGKISEKWKFLVESNFKISDRCCYVMKKAPMKSYESRTKERPILGTMAAESNIRKINYLKNGCNAFDLKRPVSQPMSFWLESDIWSYIKRHNVSYSSIYDKGYERTGCVFCMFGVHLEDQSNTRFHKLKRSHFKLYRYCMDKLGIKDVLNYIKKLPVEKHQGQKYQGQGKTSDFIPVNTRIGTEQKNTSTRKHQGHEKTNENIPVKTRGKSSMISAPVRKTGNTRSLT